MAGALLLALLVAGPATLSTGFVTDDHFQLLILDGRTPVPLSQSDEDVYTLFTGDPGEMEALQSRGPVPWFASSDLKIRFWRPLSVMTLALDRSCLLYTSPSPRDKRQSRMPSSA